MVLTDIRKQGKPFIILSLFTVQRYGAKSTGIFRSMQISKEIEGG